MSLYSSIMRLQLNFSDDFHFPTISVSARCARLFLPSLGLNFRFEPFPCSFFGVAFRLVVCFSCFLGEFILFSEFSINFYYSKHARTASCELNVAASIIDSRKKNLKKQNKTKLTFRKFATKTRAKLLDNTVNFQFICFDQYWQWPLLLCSWLCMLLK